jgi:hypothetical protein
MTTEEKADSARVERENRERAQPLADETETPRDRPAELGPPLRERSHAAVRHATAK